MGFQTLGRKLLNYMSILVESLSQLKLALGCMNMRSCLHISVQPPLPPLQSTWFLGEERMC